PLAPTNLPANIALPGQIWHNQITTNSKKERKQMDWLWFIIIGILAGWLAGKIMKGSGFGLIGDLIVGVLGALLGGWLLGALGVSFGGLFGSLLTALIGALVLLWVIRLIRR
ncbi:MAG: GlsB/YeaQ/YmgE family stress response membrane protein, partial [Anaerolineales bacterium]